MATVDTCGDQHAWRRGRVARSGANASACAAGLVGGGSRLYYASVEVSASIDGVDERDGRRGATMAALTAIGHYLPVGRLNGATSCTPAGNPCTSSRCGEARRACGTWRVRGVVVYCICRASFLARFRLCPFCGFVYTQQCPCRGACPHQQQHEHHVQNQLGPWSRALLGILVGCSLRDACGTCGRAWDALSPQPLYFLRSSQTSSASCTLEVHRAFDGRGGAL